MQKVLITGAFGQLGTELQLLADGRSEFIFTDIRAEGPVQALDICDAAAVERFVAENNVGAIVNCAAYTDVNRAESDTALCQAINADGPANLARSARRHGAALVQISTEYVFDGRRRSGGYVETDRRHPLSAYGRSKRDGEDRVRRSGCRGVIIRTSWLYSPFGKNFVKTMLRLGAEKEEIGVVRDQVGSPTYARNLAQAILTILPHSDHPSSNRRPPRRNLSFHRRRHLRLVGLRRRHYGRGGPAVPGQAHHDRRIPHPGRPAGVLRDVQG